MKISVLAGWLAVVMMLGASAGRETAAAQQAIPDAPTPQPTLPGLKSVVPGEGTGPGSAGDAASGSSSQPSGASAVSTPAPQTETAPGAGSATAGESVYEPVPGQGAEAITKLIVHVDAVDVAFTVKDNKGRQVPGLTARDVQVYENGLMQHVQLFTNEALPLSVALVIDQTLTPDEMERVNDSLGALQGAFTQYDEVADYTYNKSVKRQTEFTAAQSPRLAQAIELSKSSGREAYLAGDLSGPMSCTTCINNMNIDPNTSAQHGHTTLQTDLPREVHPLNDAILEAATALSNRPLDRRRVIYVISDGKEFGSKAKMADVIKYLQRNRIEVDGTLVGDNAMWGIGTLDRIHLPLMMRENVLTPYAIQTGGNVDADFRIEAIEKSFAKIAGEARNRYTVGYTSHEPFVDGKYRKVEVVVLNHGNNLTVMAPPGYWPMAMEQRPAGAAATQ